MKLRKHLFLFVMSICMLFGVASCSNSKDIKLAFEKQEYTVKAREDMTLNVQITGDKNDEVKNQLKYSSSNKAVATVDGNKVTGVGVGTTVIRVEWEKNPEVFATANVVVTNGDLPTLTFDTNTMKTNMVKGTKQNIAYKLSAQYNTVKVTFASSNASVFTVSGKEITAVGVGQAKLIATVAEGTNSKKYEFTITVTDNRFVVNYHLDGGTNHADNPVAFNSDDNTITLKDATKAGYEFEGWYSDAAFTTEVTEIKKGTLKNVDLYAKFTAIRYNISYSLDGGVNATANPEYYTINDNITLADATKANYVFEGWYNNAAFENKVTSLGQTVTGDINLYAKFTPVKYTITYELNGGTNDTENPAEYNIESSDIILASPTKDGYTFGGWYTDAAFTTSITKIETGSTGAKTVYAKWNATEYTITYELNGATNDAANPETYTIEDEITLKPATAANKKFIGWKLSGTETMVTTLPLAELGNITLVAVFEEVVTYTITYDLDGGQFPSRYIYATQKDVVAAFIADYNEVTKATCDPTGGDFFSRSYGKDSYGFLAESKYAAKWKFVLDIINEKRVKLEKPVLSEDTAPADIRGDIYTFLTLTGPFKFNGGEYGVGFADLKFTDYADKYLINPAIPPVKTEFTKDDAEFVLTVPLKANYKFLGYSINGDPEMMSFNFNPADFDADVTLKAMWEKLPDEYSITYVLNGGEHVGTAPVLYNVFDGLTLDFEATKRGYTFLGWSLTEGGSIVKNLAIGTRGDVTLYANFELTVYDITYEMNGGVFTEQVQVAIYETYGAIVNEFIKDYTEYYKLTGVTKDNFYTKTRYVGFVKFFAESEVANKWGWLVNYIMTLETNYMGYVYMKNPSNASNFNMYWAANLQAFFQEGKLTSPLTIDFKGTNTTTFMDTVVPKKTITTEVDAPNTYTIDDLPLALPTPIRQNGTFIGWSLDFSYVSSTMTLDKDTIGDIKLYAKWSDTPVLDTYSDIHYVLNGGILPEEAPTQYIEGLGVTLPVPFKEGYTFLGWSEVEGGTEYITEILAESTGEVTIYANFLLNSITVGEGQDYETIQEAIDNAEIGDIITVLGGKFDEKITINKNFITILGANAYVNGIDERGTESIVGTITIGSNVTNVTINGLKSTNTTFITLGGGNKNISIVYNIANGGSTADFQSIISVNGTATNLTVSHNLFSETKTNSQYRAICAANGVITNFRAEYNTFINVASGDGVYVDCIKLDNVAGTITINNNYFDWAGGNWTIFIGSGSVAEDTNIDVSNNVASGTNNMSGFAIWKLTNTSKVTFTNNSFNKTSGTVFAIQGATSADTTTTAEVIITNNSILNTSSKVRVSVAQAGITYDSNYVYKSVINSNSNIKLEDKNPGADSTITDPVITHNITYVLNGSIMTSSAPATFYEGHYLALDTIIPARAGYRFLGWYDNNEFTGVAIRDLSDKTADVTLYAKFEKIPSYNINYVLNGAKLDSPIVSGLEGTTVKLPVPTKGVLNFLGWVTEEGSIDFITEITLTGDITLYPVFSDADVLDITYVLNGGSLKYATLAEVQAEFLADYKKYTGYTALSSWNAGDNCLKVFTESNHKWDWLLDFFASVNKNSYNSIPNANAFKQLKEIGSIPDKYFIALETYCWGTNKLSSVYSGSMKSADYRNPDVQNAFWPFLSAAEDGKYNFQGELVLPTADNFYNSYEFKFVGWYDNAEFTGDPILTVTESTTVYAKWVEASPVTDISVTNMPTTMSKNEIIALNASVVPADAVNKNITFSTSDAYIVSVSNTGELKAINTGKCTITITAAKGKVVRNFEITVLPTDNIDVTFDQGYNGTLEAEGTVQLVVSVLINDEKKTSFTATSLNPDIATVNENGVVTGVTNGFAEIKITSTDNPELNITIGVTVKGTSGEQLIDKLLDLLAANNNATVWYKNVLLYDAVPYVYAATYGSVNTLLFDQYVVDHKYAMTEAEASVANHVGKKMTSLEFVTVHDTANTKGGAGANAAYFQNGAGGSSIHYVVGDKKIYDVTPESYVAYHAGDGTGTPLTWTDSGVVATGEGRPKFTLSDDYHLVINGTETSILVPTTGKSSQGDAVLKYLDERSFSQNGPNWKIIDGRYYIGNLHADFSQTLDGVIANYGGNNNSIGIEMCVNTDGDVYDSWQRTAKLVADILLRNDLNIYCVKQHNDFSGKNCPQTVRSSNYWDQFLRNVELEMLMQTIYKDCKVEITSTSDIIDKTGRVVKAPLNTTSVYYTIKVTLGDVTKEITLCSVVPGTATWRQVTGSVNNKITF